MTAILHGSLTTNLIFSPNVAMSYSVCMFTNSFVRCTFESDHVIDHEMTVLGLRKKEDCRHY